MPLKGSLRVCGRRGLAVRGMRGGSIRSGQSCGLMHTIWRTAHTLLADASDLSTGRAQDAKNCAWSCRSQVRSAAQIPTQAVAVPGRMGLTDETENAENLAVTGVFSEIEYPYGESNPGFRTENPTSWATRR